MLRELLALVASGGLSTVDGLARGLGALPSEVADMLAKLEELGYLEDAAAGLESPCPRGSAGCAGCAFSGSCAEEGARVWTLTEKGRRAASA